MSFASACTYIWVIEAIHAFLIHVYGSLVTSVLSEQFISTLIISQNQSGNERRFSNERRMPDNSY